jgi:4-amino-4-deoxy-L-arabinose transferase-like glycosyltransferase
MDFRRKISALGVLVGLTCLVQVWTLWRAVVPAQDCVRYLIVAQAIERDGLVETLRNQPEQPLFPMLVWLVHRLLMGGGLIESGNWAVCLQVAAAVPLALSVIPVYALFCRLHGEKAAFLGGLLYCVLGGIVRLGADGLSDSTHLALFCLALWAAARYFAPHLIATERSWGDLPRSSSFDDLGRSPHRSSIVSFLPECSSPQPGHRLGSATSHRALWVRGYGSAGWLWMCGLCTGLALTARGESIVLPVAVLATLSVLQLVHRFRQPWLAVTRAAGAFVFGLTAILGPYLALCQASNPSSALARLTGRRGAAEAAPLNDFDSSTSSTAVEPRWHLPGLGRLEFGKKDTSTSARFQGYLAAGGKLLQELSQTLRYWIGALALVGLWNARQRLNSPLDRFMQFLCATLVIAAVFVAAQAGYLSTRHMLLLVVLGLGWAGAGARVVTDKWWHLGAPGRMTTKGAILAGLLLVACLADGAAPLHASRSAHREAARWLTEHAGRSVAVLDSRGWTALYTGRKTYRYEAAQAAFSDPALAYVVVEQAELTASSRRSETMRLLMEQAGEPVARFAAVDSEKHGVVIHRWRPERFQQLGVQSYAR